MELSKNYSTCCSQSYSYSCSSDAQQSHKDLRVILEFVDIICPLNLAYTPINPHEFMFFISQFSLNLVHHFDVMSKDQYFNFILENLVNVLSDCLYLCHTAQPVGLHDLLSLVDCLLFKRTCRVNELWKKCFHFRYIVLLKHLFDALYHWRISL